MKVEEMAKLKKGDSMYKATNEGVFEVKVATVRVHYEEWGRSVTVTLDNSVSLWGRDEEFNSKVYFLTREEAEEAMLLKRKEKEKKIRLYQFEEQLNKELGLDSFYIKM